MLTALMIFGILIAVMSFLGIVRPQLLVDLATGVARQPYGLPFAVGVRLLLGTILIVAAPMTPYPYVVSILGLIALLAALVILLMGRSRFSRMVEWISSMPSALMRVSGIFGVVFGGFLVYAAAN